MNLASRIFAEFLQFAVQGGAFNPEDRCRSILLSTRMLQGGLDMLILDFVERTFSVLMGRFLRLAMARTRNLEVRQR